jgi:threonine aldolase
MYFGSDNQTGASSKVMEMLAKANSEYTHGYGEDPWTHQAIDNLKKLFECDIDAFFVATGTAANSLALSCLVQPWEAILCHSSAHIIVDESTAPELFTGGSRMLPIAGGEGKMTPTHLRSYFKNAGADYPHNLCAKALSITQISESGLVYSDKEVGELSRIAKQHGLSVHMDGARFANAIASQACTPAEMTWKAGVDVLCLGATKCGALGLEAVIFFNKDLSRGFAQRRKRAGHLVSKGRLFGAQMVGWLKDDHWLELATHANQQASKLSESLSSINEIKLAWPVRANELFVIMPTRLVAHLQSVGAEFYEWSENTLPANINLSDGQTYVRLVTSFLTQDSQCELLIKNIANYFENPSR